jgi:hypothetical protein
MRHQFTASERSKGGRNSGTKFRPGPDPRRHVFTRDDCRRAGETSWALFMVRFRLGCHLAIPENLAELIARHYAGKHAGVLEKGGS